MEKFFCGAAELYVPGAASRQLSTVHLKPSKVLQTPHQPCKSLTDKGVFGVIVGFPKPRATATPEGAVGLRGVTSNYLSDRVGQIMKRTYQASKVRRARTHGFLVRMKTRGGRAVINARRAKGRKRLAV